MAVFVLMLVFVYNPGNGNRYQIITDTHRNHTAGRYGANSIVPQDRLPLPDVRYSKNRFIFGSAELSVENEINLGLTQSITQICLIRQ